MMVIGDLLRKNARRIPEREAFVSGHERVTWNEFNRSVNRLANGLVAGGAVAGDRIAFILDNTIDAVRVYYAVAKIGCTSVPIVQRSVAAEIAYILDNVGATIIIAAADYAPTVLEALKETTTIRLAIGVGEGHALPVAMEAIIDGGVEDEPTVVVDPDSIYAIQFSSCATGAPKGCMLQHRNKVLSCMNMLTYVPYEEDDRALLFEPLAASVGADMLHAHVLRGMTTVLTERFDAAEVLRLVEVENITVLYAIGSAFDQLLEHPDIDKIDWGMLRHFHASSATGDLRPGVERLKAAQHFFAMIWNGYGCTESGGWLTFLSPEDIERSVTGAGESSRSIGRECLLAEVDCVDPTGASVLSGEVGEMVLHAPWLFSGYWGLPDMTADVLRAGRYHTGDLVRKDADGFIFLEGRI